MNNEKLLEALTNISGGTFIGIDTITIPVLAKGNKNPMKGRIKKIITGATTQVFSHQNGSAYEKKIKRELEAEGKDPESFELSPRRWGERIPIMPVVAHKGNYYLEVTFLNPGIVTYTLDDQPIDESEIIGLNKKTEAHQGGLENKVYLRDFKFDSLTEVRMNGQTIN